MFRVLVGEGQDTKLSVVIEGVGLCIILGPIVCPLSRLIASRNRHRKMTRQHHHNRGQTMVDGARITNTEL